MSAKSIVRIVLITGFFITGPLVMFAADAKPQPHFYLNAGIIRLINDTLPDIKKPVPENADKKQEDIIKEVPKARKQVKPIAIQTTTAIKPIKIIKPKIIKPSIKIN
jgi:hypothetical protein